MDRHDSDDSPLDHWAGEQFGKLAPDDDVWLVTIEGGRLFLIGHLVVSKITTYEDAARILGTDDLWDATHHIMASPGNVECMEVIDIHDAAAELRFVSEKDRLMFESDGTLKPQQLQSIRCLTVDSAGLVGEIWHHGEDDEDPEPSGFQSDSELRREVEQAAISYATEVLTQGGWNVESVETEKCGYDLHCERNGAELHVEVKGAASESADASFIITAQNSPARKTTPNLSFGSSDTALGKSLMRSESPARIWKSTLASSRFNFER